MMNGWICFKTTGNLTITLTRVLELLYNTALTYSKFSIHGCKYAYSRSLFDFGRGDGTFKRICPGSVEVLNQLREKRIKRSEAVLPEPATQREMMQEIINERQRVALRIQPFLGFETVQYGSHLCKDDYPYFSAGNCDRRTENIYIETGFTFVHHPVPSSCPWEESQFDTKY